MTIVDWLPIFANSDIAEIILASLRYIQEAKHAKLFPYVLMENHLHCIIQSETLSETIKAFKSYTARAIIDYFIQYKNFTILEKLRHNKLRHKVGSEYQLWQEGSHRKKLQ